MKEGIYNRVLARMTNRIERVSDRMAKEFKNTRPFDQQPVDPRESLMQFSKMTPQDIMGMRQHFGNEVVDDYLLNMAQLTRRYMKNG